MAERLVYTEKAQGPIPCVSTKQKWRVDLLSILLQHYAEVMNRLGTTAGLASF